MIHQQSRLHNWYTLRKKLETSKEPFLEVSDYFERMPRVKFYTDPYDCNTWPTPWELIDENEYCQFNIILGICYTLQLTERFANCQPEISIAIDSNTRSVYYLLYIHDKVYSYEFGWIDRSQLPETISIQKCYNKECWIN